MSIFDVSPPAWLQEIAKPPERGRLGALLGTGLAGVLNAAQLAREKTKADTEVSAEYDLPAPKKTGRPRKYPPLAAVDRPQSLRALAEQLPASGWLH